ncbi:DNA-binding CsgD family transcriptional regulator [Crossiella equi]|uniref:DNA-binding CsgD family transcriptional regulator n=1 Tax=Crossiella equi TaxID=130796 RepID=A0ABS5AKL6_9PSEU|nr:LuxR family transcriptional regulator [Crossiella equi]MBP2477120.1 DNA-binding CsgD family transcriptional regulator [Crossiella equi]
MTRQRPRLPERGIRLVGRSGELALARELIEDARTGTPRAVLVSGTAGMGKSDLLRAVAEEAEEAGLLVLTAQAAPVERDFAFGVVRQLLEPVLLTLPEDCRSRLLSGPAVLAERVLGWEALHPAGTTDGHLDTYAALHGLFRFTANLAATAPLLIAVDDVEATDPPSLRWLAYLRRRLHGLPVLLAMTRGTGREATDVAALDDLAASSVPLALTGLAEPDCAEVVAAVFGAPVAPEFAAACAEATGGNPYLLGELAHTVHTAGVQPSAQYASGIQEFGERQMAQLLLPRLRAQGPELVRLARVIAVLGSAELDLAASAAGLGPAETAAAARELVGLGVFADRTPLAFAHDLLAATLGAELDGADRERTHARAAEHLHQRGAPAEQVAAHLVATAPGAVTGDWTTDTLTRAARTALTNGAPELAVRCLRRAVTEPQPAHAQAELRLELARAELQVDPDAGVRRLAALTGEDVPPVLAAHAAHALAQELSEADRHAEAIALLTHAVDRVTPHEEDLARQLRLSVLCIQVDECHDQPDLPQRLSELRGAAGSMRASRFADTLLAFQAAVGGPGSAEAEALVLRAWSQRARSLPAPSHDLAGRWEFAYLVAGLFIIERLDLAEAHCTEMLAEARRRGFSLTSAAALGLRAQVRCRRGALAEAETDARAALAVLDELRTGTRSATIFAVSTLVEILLERGEAPAAAELLHSRGLSEDLPPSWRYNYLLVVRGLLRAALGDLSGGLADLEQCGKRFTDRGITHRAIMLWRSCAVPLYQLVGHHERAEQLAREELDLARRWGGPGPLGVALRTASLIAPQSERVALLTESVRQLESSPARTQLARSLAELALHLAAAGQTAQAGALCRRALRLAEDCGADVLAESVRRQAATLGDVRRGAETDAGSGLTPHELRIAEQVVQGRTNREIAEGFQVTSRAVEQHLTRIYRKLGIARRSQLAAALLSRSGGQVSWVRRAPGGD